MNPPIVEQSACEYLFQKEAAQIFTDISFEHPKAPFKTRDQISAFYNSSLELLMKVNIFLLSKGAFFLIDPASGNNQCHLHAFRAAQIKAAYPQKTEAEKLERNEENRFLHLSFFLSHPLAGNGDKTRLFFETIRKTLKSMVEQKVISSVELKKLPRKKFNAFLHDERCFLKNASKSALNALFENSIKTTLSETPENCDPKLYSELGRLAKEDLFLQSRRISRGEAIYTYPKFAGILYLVDALAKCHIPIVLKVKIVTEEGSGGIIVETVGEIRDPGDSALVFEAIATAGTYTHTFIKNEATKCPSYFYRGVKNKLHKSNESCFFCRRATTDLAPFRERVRFAMRNPAEMLQAFGADFILQEQKQFQPIFEDSTRYPLLAAIFQRSIVTLKQLQPTEDHPQTISICHVHADSVQGALSDTLQLDRSPETFLIQRGIL